MDMVELALMLLCPMCITVDLPTLNFIFHLLIIGQIIYHVYVFLNLSNVVGVSCSVAKFGVVSKFWYFAHDDVIPVIDVYEE